MTKLIKRLWNNDSNLKELLQGSGSAFILRIVGMGLGYLFILLVTRYYGAEAMGLYTLSFTVLQIVSVFSILGMDTLILRFTGEYSAKGDVRGIQHVYKYVLILTIPAATALSATVYFSVHWLAEHVFNDIKLVPFLQISALEILPITLLYIHAQALRGLKRIVMFSLFNGVSISFFASIILFFASDYWDAQIIPMYAHLFAILMSTICVVIAWQFYLKKFKKTMPDEAMQEKIMLTKKTMLSISMPMMLSSSLFLVMNWTDVLILGMYQTAEDVGIYSVALKVAMVTSIVLTAVNSISAPKFAAMWGKKDAQGLERIVKQSTKLIFWFTLPVLIIIWVFPHEILHVFGSEFSAGVTVLLLLTVGQLFNAMCGSVGTLLTMSGHQVIVQNILFISVIMNLIMNVISVQEYGMIGVAIATMISTFLWNGLMVFYAWKKLGFVTINIGVGK